MYVILATPPMLTKAIGRSGHFRRKRTVIERHQRRTLAARRTVGRAQVVDNIDAGRRRERRPVADLNGQHAANLSGSENEWLLGDPGRHSRRRGDEAIGLPAVQHRLAMKADHIDRRRLQHPIADEPHGGVGVQHRQLGLDRGKAARPILALSICSERRATPP